MSPATASMLARFRPPGGELVPGERHLDRLLQPRAEVTVSPLALYDVLADEQGQYLNPDDLRQAVETATRANPFEGET